MRVETAAIVSLKNPRLTLGFGKRSRRSLHSFGRDGNAGMSSRLGAGARFVVVRTPGGIERAQRVRSLRPLQSIPGAGSQSGGNRDGGPRSSHRVRGVWSRVTTPLHARERALRSLARAEAIHAARTKRCRSHPSEERRCLPLRGRANVPRGGRKRRRYVLPPCTGEVVGSLG